MTEAGRPSADLAGVLSRAASERKSGIVSASRGKLKRLFCLEGGWLTFATSNLLEEQFTEVLVRSGDLAPSDRIEADREARSRRTTVSAVVLDRNLATPEAMRGAMRRHVETLLSSCLEWPDGKIEFETGRPNLAGETTVRISPIAAILSHAKRYPSSLDTVRARVGRPDVCPVALPSSSRIRKSLDLDEATRDVLDRADGSRSIAEIAFSSPAGEEKALRAIYGLLLAGLVAAGGSRAGAAGEIAADAPLTREEVESRLAVALDADYYGVLGLAPGVPRDRIREAYYAIARRYHPDRFRSGPLRDLFARVERYFTKVTEAYNTLGSPERRAEYDQQAAAATTDRQAASRGASDQAHIARQNYLRGKQLADRKRYAEALTFLENAVRLDDGVAAHHLEFGIALARMARRREEAERHLIAAVQIDPSLTAAYLALAHLCRRMGRKADASSLFREALRWDPSNEEAAAALAEIGDVAPEPGGGILRGIFRD